MRIWTSKNRFQISFLLLLLILQKTSGSLKKFCLKSDSKCDVTWTPIENLESALVGYDLPTGKRYAKT